jgi:hypothetical protein
VETRCPYPFTLVRSQPSVTLTFFLKKKSALLKVDEFLSSFDCGSGYDSPVTVYSCDLLVVLQPQT